MTNALYVIRPGDIATTFTNSFNGIHDVNVVDFGRYAGGGTLSFLNTSNVTLHEQFGHERILSSGDAGLSLNLHSADPTQHGSVGEVISVANMHGTMGISEFNNTDSLTLHGSPYGSAADAFAHLTVDPAHPLSGSMTLAMGGGASIHFVNAGAFTAANLIVSNT